MAYIVLLIALAYKHLTLTVTLNNKFHYITPTTVKSTTIIQLANVWVSIIRINTPGSQTGWIYHPLCWQQRQLQMQHTDISYPDITHTKTCRDVIFFNALCSSLLTTLLPTFAKYPNYHMSTVIRKLLVLTTNTTSLQKNAITKSIIILNLLSK